MDDSTSRGAADPADRGPQFVPPEELAAAPEDLGAPADREPVAEPAEPRQHGLRRIGLPLALVAAGLVGGAVIGGVASAAASSTSDSVADAPSISSGSQPGGDRQGDDGSLGGDAGSLPDDLGSLPDGDHHGDRGQGRGPGSTSSDQQSQSGSTLGGTQQLQPPSHSSTGASG